MKKYLFASFVIVIVLFYIIVVRPFFHQGKTGDDKKEFINPWKWQDQFGFSQAVKARGVLYLSGQGSIDEKGNLVNPGNFEAQVNQAWDNIKKVVESAGGDMDNIVRTTIFVTDMRYLQMVTETGKKYFTKGYPASTLVQISQLAIPGMMIEIEATAVL